MKFQAGVPKIVLLLCGFLLYLLVCDKCGLVIDYYFMGTSPDGKIIDFTLSGIKKFDLSSIKMSTPRHAALLSNKFCFVLSEDSKLTTDKDHAYYDQIQHQLADGMSFL